MKRSLRWLTFAAVVALLWAGPVVGADDTTATPSSPAKIAAETCAAVLDGLRRTESATRDAISVVGKQRRRAEELRDWFGYETFGPYVSALLEQERVLQSGLEEIAAMGCEPKTRPPLSMSDQ